MAAERALLTLAACLLLGACDPASAARASEVGAATGRDAKVALRELCEAPDDAGRYRAAGAIGELIGSTEARVAGSTRLATAAATGFLEAADAACRPELAAVVRRHARLSRRISAEDLPRQMLDASRCLLEAAMGREDPVVARDASIRMTSLWLTTAGLQP